MAEEVKGFEGEFIYTQDSDLPEQDKGPKFTALTLYQPWSVV